MRYTLPYVLYCLWHMTAAHFLVQTLGVLNYQVDLYLFSRCFMKYLYLDPFLIFNDHHIEDLQATEYT